MFGAEGCGERVTFLPEGDFRWVIWDKVILHKELVNSVPPEGEPGLVAFDSVRETEEIVEDSAYLVRSWCWDTCPQKGLRCLKAGQHFAEASRGDVGRVLVVQRGWVGEPEEYLELELLLSEGGFLWVKRVPQVGIG